MLQIDPTTDDVKSFSDEMDIEFETLESVIKNALEIVDVYEKQIELSSVK